MKIRSFIIVMMLPWLLSACWQEEADNIPVKANRTLLFYMAGDNTLGDETQDKIEALTEAWNIKDSGNRLLVYQDRGGDYLPRLLEIKTGDEGKGMMEVLEEYPAENSASTQVFARVLNDMVRIYPGDDYGLIVFSHATGWLPTGTYLQPYSVAADGTQEFELREFARVIPNGQFRFIVFESCLMAGAEVAYELKSKTSYILASCAEILSPGFTPVYRKMLECLYKKEPALTEFAKAYYEYYNQLTDEARSATVSVISTAGLAPLKPLLARAETNVEYFDWIEREGIQHFDRRERNHLYYDLQGYIRTIGTQEQQNELAGILESVVKYKASTDEFMRGDITGYSIKEHCGLTVYIPVEGYKFLNKQRKSLQLFSENSQ